MVSISKAALRPAATRTATRQEVAKADSATISEAQHAERLQQGPAAAYDGVTARDSGGTQRALPAKEAVRAAQSTTAQAPRRGLSNPADEQQNAPSTSSPDGSPNLPYDAAQSADGGSSSSSGSTVDNSVGAVIERGIVQGWHKANDVVEGYVKLSRDILEGIGGDDDSSGTDGGTEGTGGTEGSGGTQTNPNDGANTTDTTSNNDDSSGGESGD